MSIRPGFTFKKLQEGQKDPPQSFLNFRVRALFVVGPGAISCFFTHYSIGHSKFQLQSSQGSIGPTRAHRFFNLLIRLYEARISAADL